MSQDLEIDRRLADVGRPQTVKGEDLDSATLRGGEEITVFTETVKADTVLFHGHGSNDRERGQSAHIYAEVLADGTGAGTDGDEIGGTLVAVLFDSEQRDVLARREIGDLGVLADAKADARTERPLFPAMSPYARRDKILAYRIIADSASDGKVVANDSNVHLEYTRASV